MPRYVAVARNFTQELEKCSRSRLPVETVYVHWPTQRTLHFSIPRRSLCRAYRRSEDERCSSVLNLDYEESGWEEGEENTRAHNPRKTINLIVICLTLPNKIVHFVRMGQSSGRQSSKWQKISSLLFPYNELITLNLIRFSLYICTLHWTVTLHFFIKLKLNCVLARWLTTKALFYSLVF